MAETPHQLPDDLQRRADEASVRKAEADARRASVDADTVAQKNRRDQLAAMLPDLSKVDTSALTVAPDGPAIGASALSFRAMTDAGSAVAARLTVPRQQGATAALPSGVRVLLTSELDLATSDAVYLDVVTGVDELLKTIGTLVPAEAVDDDQGAALFPGVDAATAVASAIPAVLSLLSAQRTLTTSATTANDTAAAAAVIGALCRANIITVHDQFRTIPNGVVYGKIRSLDAARDRLRLASLAQAELVRNATAEAAAADTAVDKLTKDIARAREAGVPTDDLETQLATDAAAQATYQEALAVATARQTAIDTVATGADAFVAAVRAPGAGGTRSMLAKAALREQLHKGGGEPASPFEFVLLIKAEAGQTEQSTTNLPLWFKDRFSTIATASITFMLLHPDAGTIVDAGTVTTATSVHGKIGEEYTLRPESS